MKRVFTCLLLAAVLLAGCGKKQTDPAPEKDPPAVVLYLGRVLPAAVMGLLVVYCLKNVSWTAAPHGLPELLSIAAVAVLHRWKGNVLLSIAGGTALYMLLVQAVFA